MGVRFGSRSVGHARQWRTSGRAVDGQAAFSVAEVAGCRFGPCRSRRSHRRRASMTRPDAAQHRRDGDQDEHDAAAGGPWSARTTTAVAAKTRASPSTTASDDGGTATQSGAAASINDLMSTRRTSRAPVSTFSFSPVRSTATVDGGSVRTTRVLRPASLRCVKLMSVSVRHRPKES